MTNATDNLRLADLRQNVGYISGRKCHAPCGGYVVVYDRERGFECDADERWIVMHEPSSNHVAVPTKADALDIMREAAAGKDNVDLLPAAEPDKYAEAEDDGAPRISVAYLQHAEFASEETHCFEAVVCVNGVAFCKARNDGHGGPDMYWALPEHAQRVGHVTAREEVFEQIKQIGAQLPDSVINGTLAGFDSATRFEVAVGDAVNDALIASELRKEFATRVLFVDPNLDGVRQVDVDGYATREQIKRVQRHYPDATILNGKDDRTIARLVRKAEESDTTA